MGHVLEDQRRDAKRLRKLALLHGKPQGAGETPVQQARRLWLKNRLARGDTAWNLFHLLRQPFQYLEEEVVQLFVEGRQDRSLALRSVLQRVLERDGEAGDNIWPESDRE